MSDPDVPPGPDQRPTGEQPVEPRRVSGLARTLLLGGVVALAFVVGAAGTTLLSDGGAADGAVEFEAPGSTLEGRAAPTDQSPLPDVTLEGFAGDDPVDLTAYRGDPLIVNFWASWCAPCVKEMPDFQEVSQELAGRVPVLGVNVQDAPANAQGFVDELGITYDLAADPRGEFYADVRSFGMPTTLLVDKRGTIVYRHTGIIDADSLRELVRERLGVDV